MDILIVSKKGCAKCKAAKEKLTDTFHVPYREVDIQEVSVVHDDWRTDNSTEIMAHYYDANTLPLFFVDGVYKTYPETMKMLKSQK